MSESYTGGAIEDIKTGLKFAIKNIPSFFLAMIGILLVTAILLLAIVIVLIAGLVYTSPDGWWAFIGLLEFIAETFGNWPEPVVVGLAIIILLPLLGPLFVAIGALYGMAREIVESEGTTAEGVFDWYSRRFFSLAGAGFAQFIVIFCPIWSMWIVGYRLLDGVIIGSDADLLIGLSVLWGLLAVGALSMTFPAVIDGNSALLSIGISMSMAKNHFGRIYVVWVSYFLMILGLLAPLLWPRYYIHLDPIPYPVVATLLIVFVVIPAMAISQSRIYLLFSGEDDQVLIDESHSDLPDTTLSGGM
ncbi:MAG: hypothetical protein ACFFAY_05270 [Promethearchaeota archaeon]